MDNVISQCAFKKIRCWHAGCKLYVIRSIISVYLCIIRCGFMVCEQRDICVYRNQAYTSGVDVMRFCDCRNLAWVRVV